MSRLLLSLVVVCAFAVVAQAAITHSITLVGSYTVGIGTKPNVDVYDVTLNAGEGRVLGALVIQVGSNSGEGDDPMQSAWYSGGKTPVLHLTPTADDATAWLTPPDASKCYETDSHFLPAGIAGWAPVVTLPVETNDGSVYSAGTEDYKAGVGSLDIAIAIPVLPVNKRVREMDVVRVGIISGDVVWMKTASADDLGVVTTEHFIIPEPATLTVLALGALGLIRRRR